LAHGPFVVFAAEIGDKNFHLRSFRYALLAMYARRGPKLFSGGGAELPFKLS
jgi:hypothetical protein